MRLAQAFLDRAGRVADLQLEVPQHVEHRLDDALAPGGLLVGQQEQEIDIRARRQGPAPVAAGRRHGETLAGGGVGRRIEMPDHRVVDDAHQLVHPVAEIAGADEAVIALEKLPLSLPVRLVEEILQLGHELGAQVRGIADRLGAEAFQDALGTMGWHGTTVCEEQF